MEPNETHTTAVPGRGRRRNWLHRLRQSDAGQALVEFSLILPVMLLPLFALVDFGRGFYSWLVITNAAREGARVGATQQPLSVIQQRINDSASGIDLTQLTTTISNVQGPRGQPIVVDLSYNFSFVTPIGGIMSIVSGGSLTAPTLTSHASMRLE